MKVESFSETFSRIY